MTSKITIDTSGLDAIIQNLPGKTRELIDKGADAVQGRAMALAPVDTGALSNSIHTEDKGDFIRWVADAVDYGIYQEMGTYKMAAHPFMYPAVEWAAPAYVKSWAQLFQAV